MDSCSWFRPFVHRRALTSDIYERGTLLYQFGLDGVNLAHSHSAGATPCSPEIHQHHASLVGFANGLEGFYARQTRIHGLHHALRGSGSEGFGLGSFAILGATAIGSRKGQGCKEEKDLFHDSRRGGNGVEDDKFFVICRCAKIFCIEWCCRESIGGQRLLLG